VINGDGMVEGNLGGVVFRGGGLAACKRCQAVVDFLTNWRASLTGMFVATLETGGQNYGRM
jgi:hypothetical protein